MIEFTIPLSEINNVIPKDIQLFLFFMITGLLIIFYTKDFPTDPLFIGGLICIVISILFLFHFIIWGIISSLPPLPQITMPISFKVT
jgi:1,4-dihydroxy-2-naphthoate octaprenyltransferase